MLNNKDNNKDNIMLLKYVIINLVCKYSAIKRNFELKLKSIFVTMKVLVKKITLKSESISKTILFYVSEISIKTHIQFKYT